MPVARLARLSAVVLAATLVVGALGEGAAQAGKPTKPGGVTGLKAAVTAHSTSYDVDASWDAAANATGYKVSLVKGGTTLASTTVKTTAWSPKVATGPGTASLTVRAVTGNKPGRPATISVPLPDVNAPTGAFASGWVNATGVATITQTALADDSGTGGITRTVNWDDGTVVPWPNGTTIQHTYPTTPHRFVPTVTLSDAAANSAVVKVPAVVIDDTHAPTGTFASSPAAAWAKFTKVTVTQSAISDDWTPDRLIVRTVDWGDGTKTSWTGSGPTRHVYSTAGTYTPAVTLTDEAHNSSPRIETGAVVVKADTVAPKVRIRAAKPRHSVKAWRTLRGSATDGAGTGVASVWAKAVEKRGKAWYGYNAVTHHWLKAWTQAKAFARAKAFTRPTTVTHRWTARLRGLTMGTLVVRARATDQVGNRSATVTRRATLTVR